MKYLRKLHDQDIVDNQKINSRDFFELVYLRHRYFRKSTNPSPERLAQFEEMIVNISDKIFFRNESTFLSVGFGNDDLRNIARVHAISFISMGGLNENPDKMQKFILKHKKKYGKDSMPKKIDIFRKEAYNLARFLRQRLLEVYRFSGGKNKNIRGTKNIKKYYIGTAKKNPSDLELYNHAKSYGYKNITEKEYKEYIKKHSPRDRMQFNTEDMRVVRAVYIEGSPLTHTDIQAMGLDPLDNYYYKNPEDTLIEIEEDNARHMKLLNIKKRRKK